MSKSDVSAAASLMGKRASEVRLKKYGNKDFVAWGKKGGRPRKVRPVEGNLESDTSSTS